MRFRFDLPARLSLFPLSGAVLMPRARIPLHVFEPRYLQMLDDALKTDHRLIGLIQPEGEGLSAIGCAGRVVAFSETDDGRQMISLLAVSLNLLLTVRTSTPNRPSSAGRTRETAPPAVSSTTWRRASRSATVAATAAESGAASWFMSARSSWKLVSASRTRWPTSSDGVALPRGPQTPSTVSCFVA